METTDTDILNFFIQSPGLTIRSKGYSLDSFDFYGEEILNSDFRFPRSSIIGLQAEECFRAYLEQSTLYRLLASNLQIYGPRAKGSRERITLGELDYIVRDLVKAENVHIELACKFFLFDPNAAAVEEGSWIGPNRRDSLLEKLDKIKTNQFQLLGSAEAIQKLASLNIDPPTQQQVCFKAFLFIPKAMDLADFSDNYRQCIAGYWIPYKDLKNEDHDAQFAIPNKKEWLLPFHHIKSWLPFPELKHEVDAHIENRKSPLIYKRTPGNFERFFVVWW